MINQILEAATRQFRYIFYAFFQPERFRREFEPVSLWQRFIFMLKLAIPMFLVSYLFTLVGESILLPFHLLRYNDINYIILMPVINIIAGIAIGVVFGIAGATVPGIKGGIAGGVAFGIAFGITLSIEFGILVSIILGIAGGIAGDIVGEIVFGVAVGFMAAIAVSIVVTIQYGTAGVGIGVGFITFWAFILGVFRTPLYLVSVFSSIWTYVTSRQRPREAMQLLRCSSLHWDERVNPPLPFLKQTLLIASDEDLEETVTEIHFIADERPRQLSAARAVGLEIAMRDLEERRTIQEIADADQRLEEYLPPEKRLRDPRWGNTLPMLSGASREAIYSMLPIGKQAQLKSLDRMLENLDKICPDVAFSDQGLNRRLARVIETWRVANRTKREEYERAALDIGNIDNPYKPGQALGPNDSLFVGRHKLLREAEDALNQGSGCPTLLLQGERNMGKTSTLYQLLDSLGSRYLPVFHNLQYPKRYARIGTLLDTIANGIYDELLDGDMKVKNVPTKYLLKMCNDPQVYAVFDGWLNKVEAVLKKASRFLLLAFDEFEKLDEVDGQGNLDLRLFLEWCHRATRDHPSIILLFSGVRTFSSMGEKTGLNWSNYFVNVQTFKVSFLNREEARHLILHPRPDYPGEEIFGAVVEQIIQQTNCHPFLVQALCSQLIDTLNVERRERVEAVDIAHAVKQVVESWDGYFDDLWKRCDESQRVCLLALDAQEGDEGMTLSDIQQHSQLEAKSIRQVLRTLVNRDLVIDNDDGTYRIAAPIFRRWVKYNS